MRTVRAFLKSGNLAMWLKRWSYATFFGIQAEILIFFCAQAFCLRGTIKRDTNGETTDE